MNSRKNVLLSGFVAALAATSSAPASALPMVRSVPPASFLEYHVDTVAQLTFEVHYDRVVQARLAHHFHLSGPAMCAYVRDHLVLKRLTTPYRTRVYCLSPRGREYFVVMTLKTGSAVFALRRTGQPILRLVCGNPLVAALPKTSQAAARPSAPSKATKAVKAATMQSGAAPAAPPVAVPAASLPSVAAAPAFTPAPGLPSEVVFTQAGASTGGGAGWLIWLPMAGGLTGLLSHLGGAGGPGDTPASPTFGPARQTPPVIVTQPHAPAPLPSPEPHPVLVFLVGALALAGWRWVGRRE